MGADLCPAISTKKAAKSGLFCGDGRTRTAVQTQHQSAFYILILPLIFVKQLRTDTPPDPYPLNLKPP